MLTVKAKETQPSNMVQKPAFKNKLQTFDRQDKLPKKMSQTAIPALYNKVKNLILREIKDVSFYSAATDMWSSPDMAPYMSLTIHRTSKWHKKVLK